MDEVEIELRVDVYEALVAEQREDESLSDVVERLLDSSDEEYPLERLSGILDEAEAERVRERVQAFRDTLDEEMDRYAKSP